MSSASDLLHNDPNPQPPPTGGAPSADLSDSDDSSSDNSDLNEEAKPHPVDPPGLNVHVPKSKMKMAAGAFPSEVDYFGSGRWDPTSSSDWECQTYPPQCFLRIRKDLKEFNRHPPPGIYLAPRNENLPLMDALVVGPKDTPYEGGFFHFVLRCPPDYPIRAPRVRLMTTSKNTVRFNPNLYKNGKVCLSILGTWSGPAWSAALGLSSLMLSIQSLMTENPYYNEPGFEKERNPGSVEKYNLVIAHETLRVAVVETIKGVLDKTLILPDQMAEVIIRSFHENYEDYLKKAERLVPHEGTKLEDPFGGVGSGKFAPMTIMDDLKALRAKISEESHPFLRFPAAPKPNVDDVPRDLPTDAYTTEEMDTNPEYFLEDLCDDDPSESGSDVDSDSDDDQEPMDDEH